MYNSQQSVTSHPWWQGAVIYQIYPRSFNDSNEDGIGDLNGITAKVAYLASLHIDAIWISPFFQSPMKDFGYDVSDYRKVDPLFGNLDDFKQLVSVCHQNNIKVIIDQVLSHTSDVHPWFTESRQNRSNSKADWYVWVDPKPDGTPPNNWQSVFGGSSWQWDAHRSQYYLHNFLASQPDLNFHHGDVQQQMLTEMTFWLELGVDGFRLDTVNYYFHDQQLRSNPADKETPEKIINPYTCQAHLYDKNRPENIAFTRQLRATINQYENRMLVGEIGDQKAGKMMQDYTGGGDKLQTAYSFRLLSDEFSASHIAQVIKEQEALLSDGWPTWAFSNHDVTRVSSRWGNAAKHRQLLNQTLLTLLCCLRGSVCIYQGEELGLTEADIPFEQLQDPWGITFWPEFKGRDGCRTPMPWQENAPNAGFSACAPWLPVPQEHYTMAVDIQEREATSTLNFTRRLLKWRKAQSMLLTGAITDVVANHDNLEFKRSDNSGTLYCWFYFGNEHSSQSCHNATLLLKSENVQEVDGEVVINRGPGFAILQHQNSVNDHPGPEH